jgi:hemolysin III
MREIWKTMPFRTLFQISDKVCPISGETPYEEYLNFVTHAFGVALGILGLVVILGYSFMCGGSHWQIVGSCVYGATLVCVYSASALYHRCNCPKKKRTLKMCDHISIYFYIAGSYTPFCLSPCLGEWGWTIFWLIWAMAILGSLGKWFFMERLIAVSFVSYLIMGWLVVVALDPLLNTLPSNGIAWMVSGGLLYSFGAIFYIWESLPFGHTIWHVLCLAGSFCHYCSVFFYVIPML